MLVSVRKCVVDDVTSWTIPPSAENASVLMESAAPSDLYFSAVTINFLTYLLYKRSNSNSAYNTCKTVADALKITVLNTKTSSAAGELRPLTPTGAVPPGPRWGLCPQTPIIGSCSHARHRCLTHTFLYPPELHAAAFLLHF